MRTATWLTCLWPGLAPLWWRGRTAGLAAAVAFAGLLNFALVVSLARPEWVSAITRGLIWCLVVVWWATSFSRSRRRLGSLLSPARGPENDRLFIDAQEQYLQGHWFEAESLLQRLLDLDGRDADARLMLATLCRRTGRTDDAARQLERLEKTPGSAKWQVEITRERESLDRVNASKEHGTENGADEPLAESPLQSSNAEEMTVSPADAEPENSAPTQNASLTPTGQTGQKAPPAEAA